MLTYQLCVEYSAACKNSSADFTYIQVLTFYCTSVSVFYTNNINLIL
jgi:hypothetical protein